MSTAPKELPVKHILAALAALFVSIVTLIVSLFVDRPASTILVAVGLVTLFTFFAICYQIGKDDSKKKLKEETERLKNIKQQHPSSNNSGIKGTRIHFSEFRPPEIPNYGTFEEGTKWYQKDGESNIVASWSYKEGQWDETKLQHESIATINPLSESGLDVDGSIKSTNLTDTDRKSQI